MKRNTIILLAGILLLIISAVLYAAGVFNAQTAYFIIGIAFVMIIGPIVIYVFNKSN